jgi:hypothetical protein
MTVWHPRGNRGCRAARGGLLVAKRQIHCSRGVDGDLQLGHTGCPGIDVVTFGRNCLRVRGALPEHRVAPADGS